MAFHFKRKESVKKAFRRMSRERIERALDYLKLCDESEGIHRVRMEIKKLRSIFRLMRKAVGHRAYRKATRPLREAAQLLASPRDARVRLKAFTDLSAHFKEQLSPRSFIHIRSALKQRCTQATASYQADSRRVKNHLERLRRDISHLRLSAKAWKAICPGICWSYRSGRHWGAMVLEEPSPENLHEWRKRVKDLYYQSRLLRPIWPEQMCAMASELKALSDLLGDHHDLVMLQQQLLDEFPNQDQARVLGSLIALRQQELLSQALVLGKRFYADKPVVFTGRLRKYWKVWRAGRRVLKQTVRSSVP